MRLRFRIRTILVAVALVAAFLGGVRFAQEWTRNRRPLAFARTTVTTTAPTPATIRAMASAARARQIEQMRGTHIQPSAGGGNRSLQWRIVEQFARQDPEPAQRLIHFRWLEGPGLRTVGWYGSIEKVSRGANGWLVSVRISPRLDWDKANIAFTPDYLIEVYHFDGKQLKFCEAIEPADAKPSLFGD